jgi:hypothetical protein
MWFLNFLNYLKRDKRVIENQRSFIKSMDKKIAYLQEENRTLEDEHTYNRLRIDAETQKLNTYGYIFRDLIIDIEKCIVKYPMVKEEMRYVLANISHRRMACESTAAKQIEFLVTCLTDREREILQKKLEHDRLLKVVMEAADEINDEDPDDDEEDDHYDEYGNPLDDEGNEM